MIEVAAVAYMEIHTILLDSEEAHGYHGHELEVEHEQKAAVYVHIREGREVATGTHYQMCVDTRIVRNIELQVAVMSGGHKSRWLGSAVACSLPCLDECRKRTLPAFVGMVAEAEAVAVAAVAGVGAEDRPDIADGMTVGLTVWIG